MGKTSSAFERHQNDKAVKLDRLQNDTEKLISTVSEDHKTIRLRNSSMQNIFDNKLVVLSDPNSADAENFKLLRGQILYARDRERPRTIMVTSTFPGEGKTYIAANLAASLAMGMDDHVLLIDCDLRRGQQHHMFGFPNTNGLHEYLVREKPLKDLIVKSSIPKLSILPAGSAPPNPTELLSSAAMRTFLEGMRRRYQNHFIIIDSAPTQITAEAKVLAEYVDAIIFVVLAGRAPKRDVQKAIHNLGKDKILGIVFNGYSKVRKSYYKYYEKYYKSK